MSDSALPEPSTDERAPYAMWVHLQANKGQGIEVESRMQAAGRVVRTEPGNVEFVVFRDRADSDAIYVYESYKDLDSYKSHLTGIADIEAVADLGDYLAQEYTVTFLGQAD